MAQFRRWPNPNGADVTGAVYPMVQGNHWLFFNSVNYTYQACSTTVWQLRLQDVSWCQRRACQPKCSVIWKKIWSTFKFRHKKELLILTLTRSSNHPGMRVAKRLQRNGSTYSWKNKPLTTWTLGLGFSIMLGFVGRHTEQLMAWPIFRLQKFQVSMLVFKSKFTLRFRSLFHLQIVGIKELYRCN